MVSLKWCLMMRAAISAFKRRRYSGTTTWRATRAKWRKFTPWLWTHSAIRKSLTREWAKTKWRGKKIVREEKDPNEAAHPTGRKDRAHILESRRKTNAPKQHKFRACALTRKIKRAKAKSWLFQTLLQICAFHKERKCVAAQRNRIVSNKLRTKMLKQKCVFVTSWKRANRRHRSRKVQQIKASIISNMSLPVGSGEDENICHVFSLTGKMRLQIKRFCQFAQRSFVFRTCCQHRVTSVLVKQKSNTRFPNIQEETFDP